MSQFLSQVALPIVLAYIMFAMGLGLDRRQFQGLLQRPRAVLLGISGQLILLPCLALLVIPVFGLTGVAAAGLFLVALCPGGATSNLFAWLAGGNVALSISLTAISSLLIPVTLPLLFGSYLLTAGGDSVSIDFPLAMIIRQLLVVTVVPVLLGMAIRYVGGEWVDRLERFCKRSAAALMALLVLALFVVNGDIVALASSRQGGAVLALAVLAIGSGLLLARQLGCHRTDCRTIALEVGIQNAGTALLVALTLLQQPEMATVPLLYGLLMNIPGFGYIGLVRWRDWRLLRQRRTC